MNFSFPLALAALVAAGPVFADPPAHAPAHGYHKKNQGDSHKPHKESKRYEGKSGAIYGHDYGISSGRCNRDEIGAVIGGISGAVIGGQVADRDNRAVGMVVGGLLGAVVGHAVGDSMDNRDRACMGHALELGQPGVPVAWRSLVIATISRRAAKPAAVAATRRCRLTAASRTMYWPAHPVAGSGLSAAVDRLMYQGQRGQAC